MFVLFQNPFGSSTTLISEVDFNQDDYDEKAKRDIRNSFKLFTKCRIYSSRNPDDMGEKATVSRLSFEAIVALGVLLCSLIIHMVSCVSNTWFWYKDQGVTHTIGVWKEIRCLDPCQESFIIPGKLIKFHLS